MNGTTINSEASWDVIIVGAGISGINAAYRLQSELPKCSYTILEARDSMGGTWDLFRYPGIRSDSDLFTFGFAWNPWKKQNPIADGPSILEYMQQSASMFGIDKHIRYGTYVSSASWSSEEGLWTLAATTNGNPVLLTARFLVFGAGYYDYHTPLAAIIPGIENFQGQTIHPQFWPKDADCTDKKVIVIGSGATAVTLVPELAQKAASTTMLQRSPTYIVSMQNRSAARPWWTWMLPNSVFHRLKRLLWIVRGRLLFRWCTKNPDKAKAVFRELVTKQLPASIPYDPHFRPSYSPWQQRLCVCPNGDFFQALRDGKAGVETGTIDAVVADGIVLTSGKKLDADIIVTATGLKLQFAGGVQFLVDGEKIDVGSRYWWNGVMVQDIPNAAFMMGFPNASWTLGADATAHFVCRFLKFLERKRYSAAAPSLEDSSALDPMPSIALTSTYVKLGAGNLPKASSTAPWTGRTSYFEDMFWAKYGSLTRGLKIIEGGRPSAQKKNV